MEKITVDFLENEKKEYLENKLNTVARHSLNKSKLLDVVRVGEEIQKLNDDFSIKVETHSVTNQEKSGRCWLFSVANFLREEIIKKYKLENFELSENYISFYDKLEKSNWFIEQMTDEMISKDYNDRTLSGLLKDPVSDGGYIDFFVNLIEKYGIVPKNAFEETYQSLNTAQTNKIINNVLRKMYVELKNTDSSEERNKIKDETLKNIYKILLDIYGVPPTKFDLEFTDKDKKYKIFRNITPLEFYKDYIGKDLKNYVAIMNVPMKDKPLNYPLVFKNIENVSEAKPMVYLNVDLDHFKNLTIDQLREGEIVVFESDVLKYSSNDDGIMSPKAFDYESLFDIDLKMGKGEELETRNSEINHGMCITGVNLDENGNPNKWRIENSWGEKTGKKGYYVASNEWFEKYSFCVLINEKFLSEQDKENLKKKPIEVESWDPII